jgi:hypothetical protein
MSYKPEVKVQGEWCDNSTTFETEAEALRAARSIFSRWMLSEDFRAVETDREVNYKFTNDEMEPV